MAGFLCDAAYTNLSSQSTDHAAMLIASTLASAAAGRDIPSASIIRDLVLERGGRPDGTVWFAQGVKLPVINAARANALMSDAAASDDSDLRNITHAGTPLTSATLAMAEKNGASGKDVLAAIVLGYEAAGRIGASITPGYRQRGFHACIIAIFSSAVAMGKLLGQDEVQMASTLALSATSIGGLVAAGNETVSREYYAGLATMLGMEAALAAHRGFVGEERVFEMPGGFCETYGAPEAGGDEISAGIVKEMGDEWDIVTDMAIKLVPGSHFNHATAEAAANAARKGNITPDEVARIIMSRPGTTTFSGPLHPRNLIDMAHSTAYFLAASVADHDFNWRHATQEKIDDPTIHQLIDKTEVGPEPTENVTAYRQGAAVTIETTDGRSFSDVVLVPKGAGCRGINWSDVDAKYRYLTPAALGSAEIDESLKLIHDFAQLSSVTGLMMLLQ